MELGSRFKEIQNFLAIHLLKDSKRVHLCLLSFAFESTLLLIFFQSSFCRQQIILASIALIEERGR